MTNKDILLGELKGGFETLNARFDTLEEKVEQLTAESNKKKGMAKIITVILGTLGGIVGHVLSSQGSN